jgi:uncharacterized protein YjiK
MLVACLAAATLPASVASQAPGTLLERHDFDRRTAWFDLPARLEEVSGLAVTSDGRLFAHDDERAVLHELDPATAGVGKRFSLGDPPIAGDFEGLAVVGERFFLVTSHGLLYEFREMDDRAEAPYRVTDTELGAHCEIEGLDYDARDDALLFACKISAPERGSILVHRIPMSPDAPRLSPIEIPRNQLPSLGIDRDFEPSAIAVDPTGTLVLVSARREAVIEVDRSGLVISGSDLPPNRHRQPEGLAFGPDGTLYIADEGDRRDGRLTAYAARSR